MDELGINSVNSLSAMHSLFPFEAKLWRFIRNNRTTYFGFQSGVFLASLGEHGAVFVGWCFEKKRHNSEHRDILC